MSEKPAANPAEAFRVPEHLVILETPHWVLNHRVDSALPGYLILGARMPTNDLALMPPEALAALGPLLARAQKALNEFLEPEHLYIARYGYMHGLSLHFHLLPICGWVKERFFADARYRVLNKLTHVANGSEDTDGAELTLFVWREFCENPEPPPICGPSINEVAAGLRARLSAP